MSAGKGKANWTAQDWADYRSRMGRQYARECMNALSMSGREMWMLSWDEFSKVTDKFLTEKVLKIRRGTRAEIIETAPASALFGFSSKGLDGFHVQIELAKLSLAGAIRNYIQIYHSQ